MKKLSAILLLLLVFFVAIRCSHSGSQSQSTTVIVMVLKSIGGTTLSGAKVSVYDSNGIVKTATTDANGTVSFELKNSTYDFVAEKITYADSMYQDFAVSNENNRVYLYCHTHGMISFPAEAPEIVSVEYSPSGSTYQTLQGSIDAMEFNYLKITARGKCAIEETSWSGSGVMINFDSWTHRYERIMPTSFGLLSSLSGDYFVTEAIYDLSAIEINDTEVDLELIPGNHYIDIVAYDVANNRVETRVDFTLTGLAPSDPDISSVVPTIDFFEALTFGKSRDLFQYPDYALKAFQPYEGDNISGYITFDFVVKDNMDNPASIRGIKVYRSEDGTKYQQIYNKTLGILASEPIYEFIDCDPNLRDGVTYYYKIKAYNTASETMMSEPVSLQFLPPYHLELNAPVNYSTSTSVSPTLSFKVSEPSFFTDTDGFVFYLIIEEKTFHTVFNNAYVYFAGFDVFLDGFSGTLATWITVSNGIVAIDLSTIEGTGLALEPGKTYEWNIYAPNFGPFFFKDFYDATGNQIGSAYTCSANYAEGYDASNGRFTLIIAENAN